MNAKIIGGVLFGALVMTGCGGDAGTTTNAAKNAATNAATNASKTAVNAVTNSMPVSGATGSLPADFPKDIPTYTGATVTAGATTGTTKTAAFSTADDPAKVGEFYKVELAKQGWTDVKVVAAGPSTLVTATKDKRMLAISIMKGADGKTMISIGESVKP